MLFKLVIVSSEVMTIECDDLDQARAKRDELRAELRSKSHHGETVEVRVGAVSSTLRDGLTNGIPDEVVGRAADRGEHGQPGHRCSGFCPRYAATAVDVEVTRAINDGEDNYRERVLGQPRVGPKKCDVCGGTPSLLGL